MRRREGLTVDMIDMVAWRQRFEEERAAVRERTARRKVLERETFERLASDPEKVRQFLAANEHLKESLDRLGREYEERYAAAANEFEQALIEQELTLRADQEWVWTGGGEFPANGL